MGVTCTILNLIFSSSEMPGFVAGALFFAHRFCMQFLKAFFAAVVGFTMKIAECALPCPTSPTSTTTTASASSPTASATGWSQGLGSRCCPKCQHPSRSAYGQMIFPDPCLSIPAYVIVYYLTFVGGKGLRCLHTILAVCF